MRWWSPAHCRMLDIIERAAVAGHNNANGFYCRYLTVLRYLPVPPLPPLLCGQPLVLLLPTCVLHLPALNSTTIHTTYQVQFVTTCCLLVLRVSCYLIFCTSACMDPCRSFVFIPPAYHCHCAAAAHIISAHTLLNIATGIYCATNSCRGGTFWVLCLLQCTFIPLLGHSSPTHLDSLILTVTYTTLPAPTCSPLTTSSPATTYRLPVHVLPLHTYSPPPATTLFFPCLLLPCLPACTAFLSTATFLFVILPFLPLILVHVGDEGTHLHHAMPCATHGFSAFLLCFSYFSCLSFSPNMSCHHLPPARCACFSSGSLPPFQFFVRLNVHLNTI